MIKLIIRKDGFIHNKQLWNNILTSLPHEVRWHSSQDDKVSFIENYLKTMNARFCMPSGYSRMVWLEFETEKDMNWFLLRWA